MSASRTAMLAALALGCAAMALAGCAKEADAPARPAGAVESSGKQEIALGAVPEGVIAAIRAARPDFVMESAQIETRDGRVYYDVEGRLPDGSEVEFDVTEVDGVWTIVEMQRDIGIEEAPPAVIAALAAARPDFAPTRIIESDQLDGVIIYEFFMPRGDGALDKAEVKYENGAAEFLEEEWIH